MKILITGNEGFIGRETTKLLKEHGHKIFGYDLMSGNDIRDIEQFRRFVDIVRPDRILHLAATARFAEADKDPESAFATNAIGTKNVAIVAGESHTPLVYSSTGSIYMPVEREMPMTEDFPGRGNSVYGCSKYLGECYVRRHASPWMILRYGHLYGKDKRYHGLIGGFLAKIMINQPPVLFGGAQTNDFAYVKDIALANLKALESPWDNWNTEYNIGTGEELSAEEAGNIICEVMDYDASKIVKVKGREVDPTRFVYNINKAKYMLGYTPKYTFKQGIADMMSEIKAMSKEEGLSDISKAGATPGIIKSIEKTGV